MLLFSFICSMIFLIVFLTFIVMLVVSTISLKKKKSKLNKQLDLLFTFEGGFNDKEKK